MQSIQIPTLDTKRRATPEWVTAEGPGSSVESLTGVNQSATEEWCRLGGRLEQRETLTYPWEMAEEPIEAIEALTKRITEAIDSGALPEDLCKLAEARAWLIWPNQPH